MCYILESNGLWIYTYHNTRLKMIDGFNGMSTHMGHVMPKRTM